MLSDLNREAMTAYDVVREKVSFYRNVAARALIVIDRSGVIRHREVAPPRQIPDVGAALAAVQALAGE